MTVFLILEVFVPLKDDPVPISTSVYQIYELSLLIIKQILLFRFLLYLNQNSKEYILSYITFLTYYTNNMSMRQWFK